MNISLYAVPGIDRFYLKGINKTLSQEIIIKEVESRTGLTIDKIRSKSRKKEYLWARLHIAYFLKKNNKKIKIKDIAKIINRDRTNVYNCMKTWTSIYKCYKKFRDDFDYLNKTLL